jgi:Ca2+-binding EF-hand superfamily protein
MSAVGPTGPPGSSDAFSSLDPQTQQKIRELVMAIISKYDKDGDGKLTREEWPSQGRWGTFDEANRFGGNVVDREELRVHLADLAKRQALSFDLPDGQGGAKPVPRKSGRFLTAKERLPQNLPEWFLQKDVDGDGQVTMAEFATEWTRERAREFDRYDLNHDGIITAAECLKAEKQAAASR